MKPPAVDQRRCVHWPEAADGFRESAIQAFILCILDLRREREELRVIEDQHALPGAVSAIEDVRVNDHVSTADH